MNKPTLPKAPDRVYNIVVRNGEKARRAKFNGASDANDTKFHSIGEVVKRTSRREKVKIQIAYKPEDGQEGTSGILYLPQSEKIRIWSLHALQENKVSVSNMFKVEVEETCLRAT